MGNRDRYVERNAASPGRIDIQQYSAIQQRVQVTARRPDRTKTALAQRNDGREGAIYAMRSRMAEQNTSDRSLHEAEIERQNEGYDEAARGGPGVPPSDVGVPNSGSGSRPRDAFDRAAGDAANDVRRREHSAD